MKNPIVNMFVAHYHFWFLKFRDRDKACHTALLFIALMLTLCETTVRLLVGGRFLQLFLNMGVTVLILALAANMAAYYFLLRLAFTPERLELEAGKLTKAGYYTHHVAFLIICHADFIVLFRLVRGIF